MWGDTNCFRLLYSKWTRTKSSLDTLYSLSLVYTRIYIYIFFSITSSLFIFSFHLSFLFFFFFSFYFWSLVPSRLSSKLLISGEFWFTLLRRPSIFQRRRRWVKVTLVQELWQTWINKNLDDYYIDNEYIQIYYEFMYIYMIILYTTNSKLILIFNLNLYINKKVIKISIHTWYLIGAISSLFRKNVMEGCNGRL